MFRFVCGALSLASLALAAAPAAALPAAGVPAAPPAQALVERVQAAIAAPHARGPQIAPPVVYPRRARPYYGDSRPYYGNGYGYGRRVNRAPAYGYYAPAPAYRYYERPRRRAYREYYYD